MTTINISVDGLVHAITVNGMPYVQAGDPSPSHPPVPTLVCETQVASLFRDILKRDPDPDGFATWVGICQRKEMTLEQMAEAFRNSPEGQAANPTQPHPSTGNPGAIVPPWGAWDEKYIGSDGQRVFRFVSEQIYAFPLPTNPDSSPNGVMFTLGDSTITPPDAKIEVYLSLTPGIINPADPNYYEKGGPGYYTRKAFSHETGFNFDGKFKAFPGGPWYMNTRLTYTPFVYSPGGYSVQWARI